LVVLPPGEELEVADSPEVRKVIEMVKAVRMREGGTGWK
jgi:hypothetical protein